MVQLLRVDAGSPQATPLATIAPKKPIVANKDIVCKLIVRPDTITFETGGGESALP